MADTLRVHAIVEGSRANGPGLRTVLWVQGCTLACQGCWNPATHPFAARPEPTQGVVDRLGATWGPDHPPALTLSGGEPMQQPGGVLALLRALRQVHPGLSVGMFTGLTQAELMRAPLWGPIRGYLDFAVIGRYDRTQPIQAPLRTSANQVLAIFRRYTEEDFAPLTMEVSIDDAGLTHVTGFPIHGGVA